MASHIQPSPPNSIAPQNQATNNMNAHALQVNGHLPAQGQTPTAAQHLARLNENVWIQIGNLTELMGDLDSAQQAYEQALRHNQWSVPAMNAISCILRTKEQFPQAAEYLVNITKLDPNNGEVWGSLGHCYLMMDNLQEAYSAYQQALYHLRDPKEPKLWYGIGILYDRYGSLEHAEEAFSQVMSMAPNFEKANEIYFRLGIIYKQQGKYRESLDCFTYIVDNPPRPLTEEDIWFQIGHVHEQQKDYEAAKGAYKRVLDENPHHAKVLQQLGWLYHQQSNSYQSQEMAIDYLEQSVGADNTDAQSWYLLGRCYMSQQKYPKAYEAYQQAVYRDGRNPTFWCSIGVLYYQINQYRDALDAYSRAIRINPYISEVWYDLGTLYESCNNQTADALDAYSRAADLDPNNVHIKARLQLLRSGQTNGPNPTNIPVPQDVHPQAYQGGSVGMPPAPQWGAPGPQPASVPQGPAPPPPQLNDWSRRPQDVPGPQPQPPNPYDQSNGIRPPPPPPPVPRQPSPRPEPVRQFPDQPRIPGARRPLSPSPKVGDHPPVFNGPQSLPQPTPTLHPPSQARIANPNYQQNAGIQPNTNGVSTQGPMPPFGRGNSPPPEIRPIIENRNTSPNMTHPAFPPFQHHPNSSQSGGIATGAPPPAAALAAADAAARERDDRPSSVLNGKRQREWENESPSKKFADEQTRARLEDHHSRRTSPTDKLPSPHEISNHRRSSSDMHREDDRRVKNEGYHPSEAAHHPTLPAMQPPQHLPPMNDAPKEERKDLVTEPAARKMEVDENYDDDGEDEKRPLGSSVTRSSPATTLVNGQPKPADVKK